MDRELDRCTYNSVFFSEASDADGLVENADVQGRGLCSSSVRLRALWLLLALGAIVAITKGTGLWNDASLTSNALDSASGDVTQLVEQPPAYPWSAPTNFGYFTGSWTGTCAQSFQKSACTVEQIAADMDGSHIATWTDGGHCKMAKFKCDGSRVIGSGRYIDGNCPGDADAVVNSYSSAARSPGDNYQFVKGPGFMNCAQLTSTCSSIYANVFAPSWGKNPDDDCSSWWQNAEWGAGKDCVWCEAWARGNCALTCCNNCGCNEELSGKGQDYRGCQFQTRKGKMCQAWNAMAPHKVNYKPTDYPSDNLVQNYCRNPGSSGDTIWCYTTDPMTNWDYCEPIHKTSSTTSTTTTTTIQVCNEEMNGNGDGYRGCQTHTRKGTMCQAWTAMAPHKVNYKPTDYPSDNLVQNYCRNPGSSGDTIWCYTTDPTTNWDYCDPIHDTPMHELRSMIDNYLQKGKELKPEPMQVLGAAVVGECGKIAEAAVGRYNVKTSSNKLSLKDVPNPPGSLTWRYASITKTLVAVLMEMIMADPSISSKPHSWLDKISRWLPYMETTLYKDVTLLDMASHTACLPAMNTVTKEQEDARYQTYLRELRKQVTGGRAWRAAAAQYVFLQKPIAGCIPGKRAWHNYMHDDGANTLAYILEVVTNKDFSSLVSERIFEPLGMKTASVGENGGHASGGLTASLNDMGLYASFLLQGYNGRSDVLLKTHMKQENFVSLFTPKENASGYGRAFVSSPGFAAHGGCCGAAFVLMLNQNRGYIVSDFPDDLVFAMEGIGGESTCGKTQSWADHVWKTIGTLYGPFETCGHRPHSSCVSTGVVKGTSMTCTASKAPPHLPPDTLDAAFRASTCTDAQMSAHAKNVLKDYLSLTDLATKVLVMLDGCGGALHLHSNSYCSSAAQLFKLCAEHNYQCGVYMVGNMKYDPDSFPCRCGQDVPVPGCFLTGEATCTSNLSPTASLIESKKQCLVRAGLGKVTGPHIGSGCVETLSGDGTDYRGCQSKTRSGKECQAWDSSEPHFSFYRSSSYPLAGLEKNSCRNPDVSGETIWCYTLDKHTRWEYCDPAG